MVAKYCLYVLVLTGGLAGGLNRPTKLSSKWILSLTIVILRMKLASIQKYGQERNLMGNLIDCRQSIKYLLGLKNGLLDKHW